MMVQNVALFVLVVILFAVLWRRTARIDKTLSSVLDKLGSSAKAGAQDKRASPRISDYVVVKIIGDLADEFIKVINLSYDGALLDTVHDFKSGDIVDLKMFLPLNSQPIEVRAKVVNVNIAPQGKGNEHRLSVGVKFLDMGAIERKRLIETVDSISKGG